MPCSGSPHPSRQQIVGLLYADSDKPVSSQTAFRALLCGWAGLGTWRSSREGPRAGAGRGAETSSHPRALFSQGPAGGHPMATPLPSHLLSSVLHHQLLPGAPRGPQYLQTPLHQHWALCLLWLVLSLPASLQASQLRACLSKPSKTIIRGLAPARPST